MGEEEEKKKELSLSIIANNIQRRFFHIPIIEKLCGYLVGAVKEGKELKCINEQKSLEIAFCKRLMGLPEGLDCLTRLKTLKVGAFCEELDAFPSLSFIQHLQKSLENLELIGWTKVNSLPDEIQCFTALKRLEIWNFDGMEALPEWLGNLSSLQMLCYCYCKNLMYLPTGQTMQHLTKLEYLNIYNCPKLKERCEKERGTEWPNIAHIPFIEIDGEYI